LRSEAFGGIMAGNLCDEPSTLNATCGRRHLALSTNSIDKIAGLGGLDALQILSLGRNLIRKIEGLEPVGETLEQLWLSYNQLERLVSIETALLACVWLAPTPRLPPAIDGKTSACRTLVLGLSQPQCVTWRPLICMRSARLRTAITLV